MATDDYAYGPSTTRSEQTPANLCSRIRRELTILAIGLLLALGPACASAQVVTLAASRGYATSIAVAGPDVVWTEHAVSSDAPAYLLAIPATGGQIRELASMPGDPTDMKIVGDEIYWSTATYYGGGAIGRALVTNGQPITLASANRPFNVAVDESFVYWTEDNGGPGSSQGLRKVPRQGGAISDLSNYQVSSGMLLIGTDLYFFVWPVGGTVTARELVKIDRNGGNGTVLLTLGPNEWVTDLATDSTYLYWTDRDAGTIKRIPLAGGLAETLAVGLKQPYQLAIFGGLIYWTQLSNNNPGTGAGTRTGASMPILLV